MRKLIVWIILRDKPEHPSEVTNPTGARST